MDYWNLYFVRWRDMDSGDEHLSHWSVKLTPNIFSTLAAMRHESPDCQFVAFSRLHLDGDDLVGECVESGEKAPIPRSLVESHGFSVDFQTCES